MTGTYNEVLPSGEVTQGGYSTAIVTDEHFVHAIPDALGLDVAAPLLCAGITTYSPLKHWGAGPGSQVAVIGLGGLGHLGVKFAAALGAEVTVLSQSLSKKDDGLRMGAQHYYATSDDATFDDNEQRFDLVINTVSANLDLDRYLGMMRRNGTFVEVGLPENPLTVKAGNLLYPRVSLSGSMIGGIPQTAGDARVRRRPRHRGRDRDHPRQRDQRGVRPGRAQRRALPLRHRRRDDARLTLQRRRGPGDDSELAGHEHAVRVQGVVAERPAPRRSRAARRAVGPRRSSPASRSRG